MNYTECKKHEKYCRLSRIARRDGLAGSAEEQRGGDILGTQYRHGDFRLDPPAPEICRQVTTALPITATMNPFKSKCHYNKRF